MKSNVNKYTSFGHTKEIMLIMCLMCGRTEVQTIWQRVPVVVLMAMSPAMLNANPGVDGLQQSDDGRSVVMKNEQFSRYETIRNIESFEINGQKKYMVFAATKSSRPDVVLVVHIVTANNKNIKGYLPEVEELIYHDLGSPKKNFCSVKIYYDLGKNTKGYHTHLIRDERIPDEVANNLLAFLANDTQYKNETRIIATKTKSAALQPDEK